MRRLVTCTYRQPVSTLGRADSRPRIKRGIWLWKVHLTRMDSWPVRSTCLVCSRIKTEYHSQLILALKQNSRIPAAPGQLTHSIYNSAHGQYYVGRPSERKMTAFIPWPISLNNLLYLCSQLYPHSPRQLLPQSNLPARAFRFSHLWRSSKVAG